MWGYASTILVMYIAAAGGESTAFNDRESDCPDEGTKFLGIYVPWGTPLRAYKTFPPEATLAKSTIPHAGKGVFSTTFIKKYTLLDEYEGEIVPATGRSENPDDIGWWSWKVTRSGVVTHYIDGPDVDTSNWVRWINCPRNTKEENVMLLACKGKLLYMTMRDVRPGQELLIYYGDLEAGLFGVDVEQNFHTYFAYAIDKQGSLA